MVEKYQRPHPDWIAPTLMFTAMLLGIGVALCQHFFYQWLDGKATDGTETHMSQSVAVGLGTAMAFVVKSSLVFAIGVAYCQLFWKYLREQAIRVTDIDSLFTALTSLGNLLLWHTWSRHPFLASIAMISW